MGVFRRKVPHNHIPIHPDNIGTNNWIILLEAGTIVGSRAEKLRVAKTTLEKRIKKKYNILLRKKHFLVLEGYDPRIHAVYFCPQLYQYDGDNALVCSPHGRRNWAIGCAVSPGRSCRKTALV